MTLLLIAYKNSDVTLQMLNSFPRILDQKTLKEIDNSQTKPQTSYVKALINENEKMNKQTGLLQIENEELAKECQGI